MRGLPACAGHPRSGIPPASIVEAWGASAGFQPRWQWFKSGLVPSLGGDDMLIPDVSSALDALEARRARSSSPMMIGARRRPSAASALGVSLRELGPKEKDESGV